VLEASLRVSATAIAVTAPVLAAHGLQVGSVGLLANLVAVPWTAVALLPASGIAALASAAEAIWPAAESVVEPLLALAEWVARVSLTVVGWLAAELPVAAPQRPAGWALGFAGLGAWVALRMPGTGQRLVGALLVTGWLRAMPAVELPPSPPRLVAFDVGMGDAVLVQAGDAAALVDAGWASPGGPDLGRSVVLPALRRLGVGSLELVVATHADLDHVGGLESVLREIPVGELWLPLGASREPAFEPLTQVARARGVPVVERGVGGVPFERGGLRVTPLWPPALGAPGRSRSRNDASLVVRVELGGNRVLLTGDIGAAAERALLASGVDLRADLLKLAHHGSAGSSTPEFLDAVAAPVALLSAACTRRGLPSGEVLTRVRQHGMAVWSTGRDGAIVASLAGPGAIVVWGWAAHPRCSLPGV
jgi:competence protein ComEC